MNVNEFKSKINETSSGKADDVTVEFVLNEKKYFIQEIKAGTDTMTINISRKSYRPYSVTSFKTQLEHASENVAVKVFDIDGNSDHEIQNIFCGPVFLEISL